MKAKFEKGSLLKMVSPYNNSDIITCGRVTDRRTLTNTLSDCFAKHDITKYYYQINNKGLYAEDVLELATVAEYESYATELNEKYT